MRLNKYCTIETVEILVWDYPAIIEHLNETLKPCGIIVTRIAPSGQINRGTDILTLIAKYYDEDEEGNSFTEDIDEDLIVHETVEKFIREFGDEIGAKFFFPPHYYPK